MEANEPPLDMRGTRLSIPYCVKLMSNDVKPAYSDVFSIRYCTHLCSEMKGYQPIMIERNLHGCIGFLSSCHRSI